jgi:hypothetical protein
LLDEGFVLGERRSCDSAIGPARYESLGCVLDGNPHFDFDRWRLGSRLFGTAVPCLRRFPFGSGGPGVIPIGFAGLLAVECAAESAGCVDEAGTFFPAAASLLKLAGSGLLGMAAFAFFAVPAVELESHMG